MSLSTKDIQHIAKLARLRVEDEDLESIKEDLNSILDHIETLQEVSTKDVPATSHVHGVVNVFRDDIAKKSLSSDEIEQNAPDFNEAGFRVPRVI